MTFPGFSGSRVVACPNRCLPAMGSAAHECWGRAMMVRPPACNQVLVPQSADDLDVPAWSLLALGDVGLDPLPFLLVDAAPPRHGVRAALARSLRLACHGALRRANRVAGQLCGQFPLPGGGPFRFGHLPLDCRDFLLYLCDLFLSAGCLLRDRLLRPAQAQTGTWPGRSRRSRRRQPALRKRSHK